MKSRKIVLLSSVLLSALLLTACGDKNPGGTSVTDLSGSDVTEETGELLGVPSSADFGGEEFNVYSAGNIAYMDFTAEEDSSLPLDVAQYRHRARVEEDYKVKIVESKETAYSSGGGPGFIKLSAAAQAGDCDYDLCLIAGYDVSVLAYSGMLYDLGSVPGIDLSKSWWDQNATKSLSLCGTTFFTTGDITCSDNDAAYVIMFNKEILKNYNLENPYELVYNNEWYMENFKVLCDSVTEDLNQDSVMDENDRYGLMVWVDSLIGMLHAAGERGGVIKDDKIELTLYNEKTVQIVEQYLAFALDKQHALQYQSIHNTADFAHQLWSGDHALFWTTTLSSVPSFRETESDFGLLPYPKFTKDQDKYYSTVAAYNSQFICVPLFPQNLEMTGTITEALAYYGQKIVLPAYYDVSLKGLHARDEESSGMLDIIFDNLVYDVAFIHQIGLYNKNLNYMVSGSVTNFTTMYEKYKLAAQKQLDQINAAYAKAGEQWAAN